MIGATALAFGPAVGGMFLLHGCLPALDWVQCWLLSITVITLLAYGYDKAVSSTRATRIPERVLLTLAFTGVSPLERSGLDNENSLALAPLKLTPGIVVFSIP